MSTETEQQPTEWPAGHRWSGQLYRWHRGVRLAASAPVLLEERFSYTPDACLRGFNVRLLPIGGGVFVCPLCGLLAQWATA